MTADNDDSLIKQVGHGDRQAFTALVRRHQTAVLNLVHRYLNDGAEAEEVTQDVFVKIWKNAKSFKGDANVTTWMFRIAVNTCLNHKRSLKTTPAYLGRETNRRQQPEDGSNPLPLQPEHSHQHRHMETEERNKLIRDAVDQLPAKQRMALVLSRFEGRSYAEIAELMKVSRSSTESLLFRAKQNLAKKLLLHKKKGNL